MMQMNNLNILKRYRNKSQMTEYKITCICTCYISLVEVFLKKIKTGYFTKIIFELKQYSVSLKL